MVVVIVIVSWPSNYRLRVLHRMETNLQLATFYLVHGCLVPGLASASVSSFCSGIPSMVLLAKLESQVLILVGIHVCAYDLK